MDALKKILQVLRLKPRVFHRVRLAAPWGMRLNTFHGASFHLVEAGEAWLRMDELGQPIRLFPGDLIVASNMRCFEILDQVHSPATPIRDLLKLRNRQGVISYLPHQAHATTTLICGEFHAEQDIPYPLFSLLPPLIHIPGEQGQAVEWLAASLKFIALEASAARPGSEAVISRLMDILFIMVMRYWIDHHRVEEGGWLSALYHPQIGEALACLHRDPQQDWTLASLAYSVHMSRSALAGQFTALVGEPPMKYLTRWRMQLATVLLAEHPQLSLEQIAAQVGYTSPFAFSKAFKRMLGLSPSEYRHNQGHAEEPLQINEVR